MAAVIETPTCATSTTVAMGYVARKRANLAPSTHIGTVEFANPPAVRNFWRCDQPCEAPRPPTAFSHTRTRQKYAVPGLSATPR